MNNTNVDSRGIILCSCSRYVETLQLIAHTKKKAGIYLMPDIKDFALPTIALLLGAIAVGIAIIKDFQIREASIHLSVPQSILLGGFGAILTIIGIVGYYVPPHLNPTQLASATSTPSLPPTATNIVATIPYTPTSTVKPALTISATLNVSVPMTVVTPSTNLDPAIYDDFNKAEFNGKFDSKRWTCGGNCQRDEVVQRDGILIASIRDATQDTGVGLWALDYDFVTLNMLTSSTPTFIEARLMLNSERHVGQIQFQLWATNILGQDANWFAQCNIGTNDIKEPAQASCNDLYTAKTVGGEYGAAGRIVDFKTWHVLRMEIDPTTMHITYYVDGEIIGSHVPINEKGFRSARFRISVGAYGKNIIGYIDDVRIGQIKK